MASGFVHLHLHSEYSLQDSTVRLKPLMEQVRVRGMGAVALTDLNNMFALVKHYKAALAQGVSRSSAPTCGSAIPDVPSP